MIKFKHKKDKKLFSSLHPALLMIFSDLCLYAKQKHNIDITVTQTVSTLLQDTMLRRKSSSHREKRAIDIRTRDMNVFAMRDIMDYINNKKEYKEYHYLSKSGEKRLAYFHIGTGEHIHLAIHSRYGSKN